MRILKDDLGMLAQPGLVGAVNRCNVVAIDYDFSVRFWGEIKYGFTDCGFTGT